MNNNFVIFLLFLNWLFFMKDENFKYCVTYSSLFYYIGQSYMHHYATFSIVVWSRRLLRWTTSFFRFIYFSALANSSFLSFIFWIIIFHWFRCCYAKSCDINLTSDLLSFKLVRWTPLACVRQLQARIRGGRQHCGGANVMPWISSNYSS